MPIKLNDVVKFRVDKLFNGAVNIDWFSTDKRKRHAAAESFVFHGPKYHGVIQSDVGTAHGHQLQDTCSFSLAVIRRCCGLEDQPFTLAIAGYGTGKSHLALSLATLLNNPSKEDAKLVLSNLDSADPEIGQEIHSVISKHDQPYLIVALNGMRNFDLTAEVTRQIIQQFKERKINIEPLEELRPRFKQARNLILLSSENIVKDLLDTCAESKVDLVLESLEKQDENTYSKVQKFFESRGMPISALGGESIRDVIDLVSREFCGEGKPFQRLIIFFDEFGRYTEFATVRSSIAGSGVLQDLFEGIQAHSESACFIGFIQFELNAYIQRIAPEYKNDILRYVTRYQSAGKAYLSINLETLIANLLEKQDSDKLDSWFSNEQSHRKSQDIANNIHSWFPQSLNHRLWNDPDQFHTVIRKGCWPLSPYSTWFLFYLAAAGKHLQERSALTLLGNVFERFKNTEISDKGTWSLAPVDLWSEELQQELISSEEIGQQGSITHAFASVQARHGTQISNNLIKILQSVVLASKMGLKVENLEESVNALSELSGLTLRLVQDGITQLQNEYNVLEWDERFKQFDILSDAVPRTQFLSWLKRCIASNFDEEGKANLFASNASIWCDLLTDLECDFAENKSITTKEWKYQGVTSNLENLPINLKLSIERWKNAISVDEPRGTVIYCYLNQNIDPDAEFSKIKSLLKKAIRDSKNINIPILIILLYDEDGTLGQSLAEIKILEDLISEEDKNRFGNLVKIHKEKTIQIIRGQVDNMIKQRKYITSLDEDYKSERLGRIGTELFSQIYNKPIPFPFDGFSTARGNAADCCRDLTVELLSGKLDWDAVVAKPIKTKNRAVTVLKGSWGIFSRSGEIARKPTHPVIREITEKWDEVIKSGKSRFTIGEALLQLCLPPYGANIASAGLFLGVYFASRLENIMIIQDGQQFDVSQWLRNEIFAGKYLNIPSLLNIELALVGEKSSEWESLLDEWEQEESHFARIKCLEKAYGLKQRVPVPPILRHKFTYLEDKGKTAIELIKKMDDRQNTALKRIDDGIQKNDVSKIGWGAAEFVDLNNLMVLEKPLWTEKQIQEIQPYIENSRQAIIQLFPKWLSNQAPRFDSPTEIGDFKHKMLNLVGGNLKKLGLNSQYNDLETRTSLLTRKAEIAVDARQLVRSINSWIQPHADLDRIIRIAKIRGLKDVGKDYSNKLLEMSKQIDLDDLSEVKITLDNFLIKLKETESAAKERFSSFYKSQINSEKDIIALLDRIDDLEKIFEGCTTDLEDLRLIQGVLRKYYNHFKMLQDDKLSWKEFDSLAKKLRAEFQAEFKDEEIPWKADEVYEIFFKNITEQRKMTSLTWLEAIESESSELSKMPTGDVKHLHDKATNPPTVITDQNLKQLDKIVKKIETRLEALDIDWLVEKFKDLPKNSKVKFMKIASKIIESD